MNESRHMSHICLSHVTSQWVTSRVYRECHVSHICESSHISVRHVTSHIWMSHVTCHTYDWVTSRVSESRPKWFVSVMSSIFVSQVNRQSFTSCHTYEWVTSHVTHMPETRPKSVSHVPNASSVSYGWVTSHVTHMPHICSEACHITHVNESRHISVSHVPNASWMSCHTYLWVKVSQSSEFHVMSHIWMSHVTRNTYEWVTSRHVYECVTWHISKSRPEWFVNVMSHIWMTHVTYTNELRHTLRGGYN